MTKFTLDIVKNESEIPEINAFIHATAYIACKDSYTSEQLKVLNDEVFGIHTGDGAIEDATFFVIKAEEMIVATGGWSRRQLPSAGGGFLIPGNDPARLRTFFVHPKYHGKHLGSLLLHICERSALDAGFISSRLYATLNAEAFYAKHGYMNPKKVGPGITIINPLTGEIAPTIKGQTLAFIHMDKCNLIEHDLSITLNKLKELAIDIDLLITFGQTKVASRQGLRYTYS